VALAGFESSPSPVLIVTVLLGKDARAQLSISLRPYRFDLKAISRGTRHSAKRFGEAYVATRNMISVALTGFHILMTGCKMTPENRCQISRSNEDFVYVPWRYRQYPRRKLAIMNTRRQLDEKLDDSASGIERREVDTVPRPACSD